MFKDMFDLGGRVAVVVGGGGGIGSVCARGFAEFGAHVAVADYDLRAAEAAAAKFEVAGARAIALQVDVTDMDQVQALCERIVQEYGKIDILLNSVGATVRKPLLDITQAEWNDVVSVNLTSAFLLSKVFGREMIRNGYGKVIQIASTGALRAGAHFSAYGASKAGLVHLVKSLALDWAPHRINVNAIAPTATETAFTAEYYKLNPDKKAQTAKNHPFGRLGKPEDYVGAAVYLASRASDFVTGEVIVVDGGKTV